MCKSVIENAANCPKCLRFVNRQLDTKINCLECHICNLFFCFNCGKQIGVVTKAPDRGWEEAVKHYELAFCHFKA